MPYLNWLFVMDEQQPSFFASVSTTVGNRKAAKHNYSRLSAIQVSYNSGKSVQG